MKWQTCLLLTVLVLSGANSNAQDTIRIDRQQIQYDPNRNFLNRQWWQDLLIQRHNPLAAPNVLSVSNSTFIPVPVRISVDSTAASLASSPIFDEFFLSNNSFSSNVLMGFGAGTAILKKNNLTSLTMYGGTTGLLTIDSNTYTDKILVTDMHLSSVVVKDNPFSGPGDPKYGITFARSSIGDISVDEGDNPAPRVGFKNDTLGTTEVTYFGFKKDSASKPLITVFYLSHINNIIRMSSGFDYQNIEAYFYGCTFENNARIELNSIDTLEFWNCTNINTPVLISLANRSRKTYLKLRNTNIANLKFDYLGGFRLYIWPDDDELNRSNYENLIAKFESEKKEESLKNLRIEYYNYAHNRLLCILNATWWYYGYHKELILGWTALFLLIFFLINLRYWESLQQLYPVIESEPGSESQVPSGSGRAGFRKKVTVLAFTSMIFFSLKIDFQKLSFKNPALVIYFFIQYLVGLGCLFFIFNAILKL